MSAAELQISVTRQRLRLLTDAGEAAAWDVSTSRYGMGQIAGSYCTPAGLHVVRAKIGAGLPEGAVLVGRRPTGEVYTANLARKFPGRDWILTRILWLSGCEPGINRLGSVDSMRRFIYVHGTPDSEPMGVPWSHGCIRMRNADMLELFDLVKAGTLVRIEP